MTLQTKICGLSTKDTVDAAVAAGAAFIGSVFFAPSPRAVTPEQAARITSQVPPHIKKVAVIVDMTDQELETLLADFTPDYLQLHGKETPERTSTIRKQYGLPVIKALSLRTKADLASIPPYEAITDMLLFDAKPTKDATLPGGNGIPFDWHVLEGFSSPLPWFLSGGLSCQNLQEAVKITGASLVDISSGLESKPGVKSIEQIQSFLTIARTL